MKFIIKKKDNIKCPNTLGLLYFHRIAVAIKIMFRPFKIEEAGNPESPYHTFLSVY